MSQLMLCEACSRHFRLDDACCPFCAAAVTDAARERARQRVPVAAGASRAKRYAASMALVASSAALACGSSESGDPEPAMGGQAAGGTTATGGSGGSSGSTTAGSSGSSGSTTAGSAGTGGSQAGSSHGGQAGGGSAGKAGGGQGGQGQGGAGQGGTVNPAGGFLAHPYGCVWPDDEDV